MVVAGASAYPRLIDYAAMAEIAREVDAHLMVDMAHIAGLVAAGVIPSPVPHSDFVTFTCYKTLMGGRGGVILCREAFSKNLDRAVFPGTQGTSPVNAIAAKAFVFHYARQAPFIEIQKRTLANARALSEVLETAGWRIVTGGTDNHQVLLDAKSGGISGGDAEQRLESVGIVANRNAIPSDANRPGAASGLRLGTAAISSRGMGTGEARRIGTLIDTVLRSAGAADVRDRAVAEVRTLCAEFPVYT
jgi:glycine hydroxymethyltransferase